MKKILSLITLLTLCSTAIAADFVAPNDNLKFGKSSSASDKKFIFDIGQGANNPYIRSTVSGQDIRLMDDNFLFGLPASGANKTFKADVGNGSTNPALRYNLSGTKWEFSNDGTNYNSFGSGSGAGGSGINMLSAANPDVETGTTGYTASGGTLTTVTSGANLDNGLKTLSWTPSAGAQTLVTAQQTVPGGLFGRSCVAKVTVKTAETANPYVIQAIDGSSNVLGSFTVSASTIFSDQYANFLCPSSGTVAFRINTPASAPTNPIYLDDFWLGSNYLLANVSQSSLWGGLYYQSGNGCVWSQTSASWSNFPVAAGCTQPTGTSIVGNASIPATKVPGITFATLPPGDYMVVYQGDLAKSAAVAYGTYWRLYDGTNSGGESRFVNGSTVANTVTNTLIGRFTYTTAQSNITFQIQGYQDSGGSNAMAVDGGSQTSIFMVYRYPTASDTVFRPDSVAMNWSGFHDTNCQWATSSLSYADFTGDATCTFTTLQATNLSVTSATNAGNNIPGVVFTPNRAGHFNVCFTSEVTATTNSFLYQLVDASSNVLWGPVHSSTYATSGELTIHGCANVYASSAASPMTVKLQIKVGGGTATVNSDNDSRVMWSIIDLDAPMPAPVFQGFIGSNTSGQERVERARIANNGTVTITSQSGTWITGTTRNAAGDVTLTIASGAWSSAPSCVCMIEGTGRVCGLNATPTSTSVETYTTVSSTGTAADMNYSIICMGPH